MHLRDSFTKRVLLERLAAGGLVVPNLGDASGRRGPGVGVLRGTKGSPRAVQRVDALGLDGTVLAVVDAMVGGFAGGFIFLDAGGTRRGDGSLARPAEAVENRIDAPLAHPPFWVLPVPIHSRS